MSGFLTEEQNRGGSDLDDFVGVADYRPITPPPFVPLNFGANAKMHLALGVHMMGVFNASERYLVSPVFTGRTRYLRVPQEEWNVIIRAAGLHITNVKSLRANVSVIECRIACCQCVELN
jgi:hypothetical protein